MSDPVEPRTAHSPDERSGVLPFERPLSQAKAHLIPGDIVHESAVNRAFKAIHDRLYGPLRSYARSLATPDNAEDAVASAFTALWDQYYREPTEETVNPDAFLFNAVYWRIQDLRRNKVTMRQNLRAYLREMQERITPVWVRAERRVTDESLKQVIIKALAKQGEQTRNIFMLRFYGDLKINDIAAMVGVTRGTVTNLLTRAANVVRPALERAGYAEGYGNTTSGESA